MLKGVFFDLGGTLFSYRTMSQSLDNILSRFAQRQGRNHSREMLASAYHHGTRVANQTFAKRPFYLIRDYFQTVNDAFFERLCISANSEDDRWLTRQQSEIVANDLVLKPDCHRVLDALIARGIYRSIVSNIDEDMLWPLVERGDLAHRFDHCTSSEAAGACKPDGKIFAVALEKSGFAPNEVLFVGDSMEQDILGANAAGMHTALIQDAALDAPMHIGTIKTTDPDYRVGSLSELLPVVENLIED